MIYRNYLINAEVQTWDTYEVNDDGTLGDYKTSGGGDTESPMYVVWELDEDGDEADSLDEFNSIDEAKAAIDEHIKTLTTFQSEASN